MREFTKSMMSYTWAMSLFGVQQMVNAFRPADATESFDNVTDATRDELGDALRATFRAGDNLQRGLVDLTFSVFTLGMFNGRGSNGRDASCRTSDLGRRTGDVFRQSVNAAGQMADAFGQAAQGTATYAADATRQSTGRWAQRDAGRRADTYERGGERTRERGGRAASDLGRQTADAFEQGVRAMGQAADVAGRTMEGAAYAAADAMGADDPAAGRGSRGATGTQPSGAAKGQSQRWGAPATGRGSTRR